MIVSTQFSNMRSRVISICDWCEDDSEIEDGVCEDCMHYNCQFGKDVWLCKACMNIAYEINKNESAGMYCSRERDEYLGR